MLVADRRSLLGLALAVLLSIGLAPIAVHAQDAEDDGDRPPRGIPRTSVLATVRKIVDGDTLRITLGDGTKTTVRLLGVDAPDPNADDPAASCYGDEATERFKQLVKVGREIWLESDKTDEEDGRLLRYVWVEKNDGSVYFLNEVMLRDGYAVHAPSEDDTKRADRLEKAQKTAQAAGRGLWFECQQFRATPTPTPQPTPAAPQGFTAEEQAYQLAISGIMLDMSTYLSDLGVLLQFPDIGNDDWTIAVAANLVGIQFAYDETAALVPPPAFAGFHGLFLQAMELFNSATYDIIYGIDNFDAGSLESASNKMTQANALIDQATAELARLNEERGV